MGLPRHTWQHPGTPEGVARAALWCASACETRRQDSPRITNDVFSGMFCWGNVPSVYFWKFLALRRRVQSVRKYHACQSKSRFSLFKHWRGEARCMHLVFHQKTAPEASGHGSQELPGTLLGAQTGSEVTPERVKVCQGGASAFIFL